ncbi:hypothetical protein [Microbacterium sp. zg.Y1084]|uniref:hypothetical protein n=1 Tax=Microbacterium sp. zg.Y1084 TaxID=2969667 RepID=UPI00214AB26E|nr:hypothetical protein [Microbacterium sp. zg.Y1084]MCR2811471.1 hypothetical protein [Microbacterium sp. zg.Y1084]
MNSRSVVAAVGAAVIVALLTACTPEPQPAPTPTSTGFASEADAFAAAEETYRAYVDALNQVDLSDPATFEAVYAWTTGEANANERQTLSTMHAESLAKTGSNELISFRGDTGSSSLPTEIAAVACVDVSTVEVIDLAGDSVVSASRPDRYALQLELIASPTTPTGLQIASSNAIEDPACAPVP